MNWSMFLKTLLTVAINGAIGGAVTAYTNDSKPSLKGVAIGAGTGAAIGTYNWIRKSPISSFPVPPQEAPKS